MINRIKKTRVGRAIYLFSQKPTAGWPLRKMWRVLQAEMFQPAHLFPDNVTHNRHQRTVLKQFEAGLK